MKQLALILILIGLSACSVKYEQKSNDIQIYSKVTVNNGAVSFQNTTGICNFEVQNDIIIINLCYTATAVNYAHANSDDNSVFIWAGSNYDTIYIRIEDGIGAIDWSSYSGQFVLDASYRR